MPLPPLNALMFVPILSMSPLELHAWLYMHGYSVCAGVGLMVTRLGDKGSLSKGPMGLGFRLQDNFQLGPFTVSGRG